MPFRSPRQYRYLMAKHPEIARRWQRRYGVPKGVRKRKGR